MKEIEIQKDDANQIASPELNMQESESESIHIDPNKEDETTKKVWKKIITYVLVIVLGIVLIVLVGRAMTKSGEETKQKAEALTLPTVAEDVGEAVDVI